MDGAQKDDGTPGGRTLSATDEEPARPTGDNATLSKDAEGSRSRSPPGASTPLPLPLTQRPLVKRTRNTTSIHHSDRTERMQRKGNDNDELCPAPRAMRLEARFAARQTALTAMGTAFAGYQSLTKLITDECPTDVPCPLFVGLPACYFGLAMFAAMLLASALAVTRRIGTSSAVAANVLVGAIGCTFAYHFAKEEYLHLGTVWHGPLGLSTCTLGFLFFVLCTAHAVVVHAARVSLASSPSSVAS